MTNSAMTHPAQTLVSTIVLCYNQSRFVIETLEGVKAQTYGATQLIIVDDCSSDESVSTIDRWVHENGAHCTFIRHQRNQGICRSLNDALAVAAGKYISMTASDDVWLPDKLLRQVEIMESQPDHVGLLYSDAFQIDENSHPLPDMFIGSHSKLGEIPQGQVLDALLGGNFLPAMTTLVRRSCYEKVGIFDEDLPFEDWDMWMRIARHYSFIYSPTPSARYRVHSQSYTQSKSARMCREAFQVALKQLRIGDLSEDQRSKLTGTMLYYAMEVYRQRDPEARQVLLDFWQAAGSKKAMSMYWSERLGVSYRNLQRANGFRKQVRGFLGSPIRTVEQSARSARLLAARCLPRGAKTLLKTGPGGMVVDALDRLEVRVFSQGLSHRKIIEPSVECRTASASMSLIVPIHDAPSVTRRCLASLERDAPMSEVILVDDCSRLSETTGLIQEFSSRNGWKVVRHTEAVGHSAACAAGASLANRPYLCLLNSDTVVTPWCWRAIQQAFESDPAIGVAGPSSSSSGNEQTLDIAIKCRFYWNDSQLRAFAERLTVADLQPEIVDLPWISGFALFIRRGLWEKLGGFDRNLGDYANEVELCKRVSNLGLRTIWVRSAYIHHLGGQSYKKVASAPEIESRLLASLQYIRNRHQWDPPVHAGYTTIVRSKDGKTWAFQSDRPAARP